jgi:hypothetical protein
MPGFGAYCWLPERKIQIVFLYYSLFKPVVLQKREAKASSGPCASAHGRFEATCSFAILKGIVPNVLMTAGVWLLVLPCVLPTT